MTALTITGGQGFLLGRLAATLLERQHEVVVVDRKPSATPPPTVVCDLSQCFPDQLARTEVLVAGAAEVTGVAGLNARAAALYESNRSIDRNTAELARQLRPDVLLYVSSSCVYDAQPRMDCPEVDVASLARPPLGYSLAKYEGEQLFAEVAGEIGARVVFARIFNAYGPGERPKETRGDGHVIPDLASLMLRERPEVVTVFGDGTQTRTFTYVDDVVDALRTLCESDSASGPYNIASGEETSIRELVAAIASVLGVRPPEVRAGTKHDIDVANRRAHAGRLAAEEGWQPKTELADGLANTIEWLRRS